MSDATPLSSSAAPPPAVGSEPRGGVLRNRSFARQFSASVTSSLGAAVSQVAVIWIVFVHTGSALAVSYVGVAAAVPGAILGFYAGVLVDRHNRRTLMILSDSIRAVAVGSLAVYLALAGFNLALILGVVVVLNGFAAFFNPAANALLPRIVRTDELEDANGLLLATNQGAQVVGAALGGLLIVLSGATSGLAVNALTYALSAILIAQIAAEVGAVAPRRTGTPGGPTVGQDFREGIAYLRAHPVILEITVGFLPVNFLAALCFPFIVVYNADLLAGNAAEFAYLVASISGGIAVGALLVGRLRARRAAGITMIGSIGIAGAGALGLAFVHTFVPALVLMAVVGLAVGLINTVYFATMQAIVPNDVIGRVLSFDTVATFVAFPVGIVVGGLLIAARGVAFDFGIAGVGMIVNGVALLPLRPVRSLRYGGRTAEAPVP